MSNQAIGPQTELQMELEAAPMGWRTVLGILLAAIGGAVAALWLLPLWLPGLTTSLAGSEPKAFWYMARASAFVAYTLLWFSINMGLLITGKQARVWPGGPLAFDLHQYLSILGLAFGMFHALILLGDAYSNYTLGQLLLPFSSSQYRPLWVGLGQLAFYVALLLLFSFYARRWLGPQGWRKLHYLSFAVFMLTLLHGLGSGTDSSSLWANILYWATGGITLFLTIYRIIYARLKPAAQLRQRHQGKQFAIDLGTHRRKYWQ